MKEEQIDRLLKIIEENGYATVKYIAKAVYASESTVRRQLAELEHMGLVVRSYGGAELKKDSINTPIEMRLQKNHRQKDAIARLCETLAQYGVNNVYCLGGFYKATSKVFTGEYAVGMAQKVYYDYFFFSSSGFSDGIISDYSTEETHIRRVVLGNSELKYFLCDSGKFGKHSANILCRETEISGIISE